MKSFKPTRCTDFTHLFGEISASSWFYYKEICYDVQSHERKIWWRALTTNVEDLMKPFFETVVTSCLSVPKRTEW